MSTRARLAALFLLALGLRLAYLLLLHDPFGGLPVRDAAAYDAWARRILAGVPQHGPFFADPLYAYLLAGTYAVFGVGVTGPLLALQAVLDAARVLVMFSITRRAFGRPFAALAAAALTALLEPYVAYAAAPLKTSLSLVLVDAALLLALVAAERRTARAALGFGLAAGLATLTRPNVLLILLAFSGWAWLWRGGAGEGRRGRARCVAAAWLGTALVIAPVTAANYARSGELVLISANFGHNLYLGNHPGNPRSGLHLSPPGIQGNPLTEEQEWQREAERRAGRTLSAGEREVFWLRSAARYVASAPGDFLIRTAHKALLLLNAYEVPDNRNVYLYRRHVPWFVRGPAPLLTTGLALSLALLGVLLSWGPGPRRFLLLCAATYAASLLPFVVSSRYRLPLLGPLLPFAGFALDDLRRMLGAARRRAPRAGRRLGRALVAFGLLFALVHLPLVDANAYFGRDCYDLAVLQNREGRREQALASATEALARDPHLQQAWIELGIALEHLDRGDDAARHALPLLDWNPSARARARALTTPDPHRRTNGG